MKPMLRFTPYAWAKMVFMRDRESQLEVGAFGVSDPKDVLLVRDIVLPKQEVSGGSVEFLELPAFYEGMDDKGYSLQQFSRIWIHTHPFDSATPSATDENTFSEVFGNNDWGVMFILAKTGKTTCRLQVNPGVSFSVDIDWRLVWNLGFPGSNITGWEEEYKSQVSRRTYTTTGYNGYQGPYQTGFRDKYASNVQYAGMHQTDPPFKREREMIERSKKNGRSGNGYDDDDDDKLFEEHAKYQRLQALDDDDPRGPFGLGSDIPWIAD